MTADAHAVERAALALLDDLLDLPESDRQPWIDAKTADPAVKARLGAMLEADRIATLRTGAAVLGLGAGPSPLPDRIGNYRITGLIGRGGMGAVYRGTRAAGDFGHEAAIKVIKQGLLSEELQARFRAERQTLASLDHPNIARLLDGGQTADGSPYIVMELVDGEPIDRWANARSLDTAARLALVETAARAVAHAHKRLVVHRDITPLNVLVTAEGAVKLIDFGIARPLAPGEASTGADIAALGRLLGRLVPDPDRELAAIVARATDPDESHRYATAEALAADCAAWAAGQPVAAMDGGERYRMKKFVGRNRLAVAATALAAAALVGGLGVSLLSLRAAEAARAAEAQRFSEVRQLASWLVFDFTDRLQRTPGTTAARAALVAEAQRYLDRLAVTPAAPADVRVETARGFLRLAGIQASPVARNLGDVASGRRNMAAARSLIDSLEGDSRAVVERARLDSLEALFAIHHDRDGKAAARRIAAAETGLEAVPAARRDARWHLARAEVGRAAMEIWSTDEALDRLAAEAAAQQARVAAWPPGVAGSFAARLEQAHALYQSGLVGSIRAEGDHGAAALLASHAAFRRLAAERVDDPDILYMVGWSGPDSYAAAQRAGRLAESEAPLEAGSVAVTRLATLDTRDRSAARLFRTLGEVHAQHLSNTGRPAEAIAAQQAVVARTRSDLARLPDAHSRADLAFNQMILGVISKRAGNRALTCDSWREALAHFRAVAAAEGRLIGFHQGFLPGLARNVALCAGPAPLGSFQPLR